MENDEINGDAKLTLSSQDLRSPAKMAATLGYDAYAEILASTISSLDTPANVGIFAGWGSGKSYLMGRIKDKLYERSRHYRTTRGLKCIWMLWRLVFFIPPQALKRSDEVRFISASFNALEYAGSDHLWAGLVTRLVGAVEFGIGILPSAIFRAKRPRKMPLQCMTSSRPEKICFKPKMLCNSKIPCYALFIMILFVSVSVGTAVLVLAINAQHRAIEEFLKENNGTSGDEPQLSDETARSLTIGSIILSFPLVAFLKDAIPVLLKVINSQKVHIQKMLSRPDFSQELGVMAKVKEEIRHLSKLVRFMELFEQRRIVVAIFIDDLDKLPQQNIAPLLQAIKILLSDPACRFVSIIAIDPYSVSDALEMGIQSQFPAINISGHKFLKQMIQVPFSIPTMNNKEKDELFRMLEKKDRTSLSRTVIESPVFRRMMLSEGKSPLEEKEGKPDLTESKNKDEEVDGKSRKKNAKKEANGKKHGREGGSLLISKKSSPVVERPLDIAMNVMKVGMPNKPLDEFECVAEACDRVMSELRDEQIFPFMKNNLQELQRLVGIAKVTTRVVFRRILETRCNNEPYDSTFGILPRHLAAWVVLVGQWPYRITWMIQQVEDRADAESMYSESDSLFTVYRDSEANFTLVNGWRKLIQLDGDPDDLEKFLEAHSEWLNVGFLINLLPHTISLDRSLKSIVAWTSVERDLKTHATHTSKPLSHMDVEDVIEFIRRCCKGSCKLDEYASVCQANNINGLVLLRGEIEEVKMCLKMSLGDWTLFSHALLQLRTVHKFKFST